MLPVIPFFARWGCDGFAEAIRETNRCHHRLEIPRFAARCCQKLVCVPARQLFQGSDIERLRTLAHQLKGAAGSYGFGPISPVAEALEKATEESSEAEIAQCVEDLVGICQRARAGSPN